MATFNGYLIKATATNKIFPNELIALKNYKSKPNSRQEIKATRDDYTQDLTRITASGLKSTCNFTTTELSLAEMEQVLKFFTDAEVDALQRKIQITYWNDENLSYKTGYFYRPDMEFTIKEITNNDIKYEPLTIKLVEY